MRHLALTIAIVLASITTTSAATITVAQDSATCMRGDVNGDSCVDVADINIVTNIILGNDRAEKYDGRADVNNDGEVNIVDVSLIINILLNNDITRHWDEMQLESHRGYWDPDDKTIVENTISAIRAAKSMGYQLIETDVAHTLDNELVLFHNYRGNYYGYDVSELCTTGGWIENMTLEQVKNLVFKDNDVEKIPTVREVLLTCRQLGLLIEFDCWGRFGSDEQAQLLFGRLCDIIEETGMKEMAMIKCSMDDAELIVETLGRTGFCLGVGQWANGSTSYVEEEANLAFINALKTKCYRMFCSTKWDTIANSRGDITTLGRTRIDNVHNYGMKMQNWTIAKSRGSADEIKSNWKTLCNSLFGAGVDIIMTNDIIQQDLK